jgi:hypothetical protein
MCIFLFSKSVTLELIQAKVVKNVKQTEGQAKSYPPRNRVVSCAETWSGSLPDSSMMSRAMLRWVAMPSSRKTDERQVACRSPLRSTMLSAMRPSIFPAWVDHRPSVSCASGINCIPDQRGCSHSGRLSFVLQYPLRSRQNARTKIGTILRRQE